MTEPDPRPNLHQPRRQSQGHRPSTNVRGGGRHNRDKERHGTGKRKTAKGKRRYKKKKRTDDFGMGLGLGGDYEDRLADEREERRVSRSGVDRL